MKKLNSPYSPLRNNIPSNEIYEALNSYFMEMLPPSPSIDYAKISFNDLYFKYDLRKTEQDFYENDYLTLSPKYNINNSKILNKYIDNSNFPYDKLGNNEKDLLEIFYDENTDNRINIITGEVGWGKSTTLKASIFYLSQFAKTPNKILPLYFDFNLYISNLNKLKEKEIQDYIINNVLEPYLLKVCEPFLLVDNDEFWGFCFKHPEYSIYSILSKNEEKLQPSKRKYKQAIFQIRNDLLKTNKGLIFICLKFLIQKKGIKLIFALDNLDPIRYSITSEIIKLFHSLCHTYFFKVIIPMRASTLSEMKNKRYAIYDALDNVEIQFTIPDPYIIISNNRKKIIRNIKKNNTDIIIGHSIIKNKNIILIIDTMFELINKPKTKSLIRNISDGDMKEWGKILRVCFSSGLISSHKIISNYMKIVLDIKNNHDSYNPEWIPYTSIITNNKRTFFSRGVEADAKDRICNLFCNKLGSVNIQLIRLHILSFFERRSSSQIKILTNTYSQLFNKSERSIYFAIRIMTNTKLIKSNRFHKIDKTKWVKNMQDISINKECGVFYLNHLIEDFNYLKFMKDDTFIPLDYRKDIHCVIEKNDVNTQFCSIFHFIKYLFSLEIAVIRNFKQNEKNIYLDNFSPNKEIVFFTYKMASSMLKYGKWNKHILEENVSKMYSLFENIEKENKSFFDEIIVD